MRTSRGAPAHATPHDVAISVASADVAVAAELSRRLARHGLRVYHYREAPAETLGEDLRRALTRIYAGATLVIVVAGPTWGTPTTRLELAAALGGEAGERGIVPVLLPGGRLPKELEGRTWWSLEGGTRALVRAVAAKLRRAPLSTPVLAAIVVAATSVAAGLLVAGLGFGVPGRWPDTLFHAAIAAPAAWLLAFHVGPALVTRLRARRRRGGVLLQGPMLRRLDVASRYVGSLAILGLVLALAAAVLVRNEVRASHRQGQALLASVDADYTDLRAALNRVTTTAAAATTHVRIEDLEAAKAASERFERDVEQLRRVGSRLRTRIGAGEQLGAPATARAFLEHVQVLERVAESQLRHQVRELAREATLTEELKRSRRLRLSRTLVTYNGFFVEEMHRTEAEFRRFEAELHARLEAEAHDWRGLLPNLPGE